MANKVRGRRIFHKRRSGGGGWRGRGGAGGRRGSGSDATSDEDYIVGEEEEEEEGGSSYSSDAFREDADQDAGSISCTEEEEDEGEEEYDVSEDEVPEPARGRRPQKRPAPAGLRRKPKAKLSRRRRSGVPCPADELEQEVESPGPRRRSKISAEYEEEYEDDDDEDFAPEEDDDDEGEQLASSPVRNTGGRKNVPVKKRRRQRRRRSRTSNSKGKVKKKTAPAKKRRRRTAPNSDDDDFVVDDAVSVEGMNRKRKGSSSGRKRRAKRRKRASISDDDDFVVDDGVLVERTNGKKRKEKTVSKGKKRRPRVARPDASDSDFDYTISEGELRDLQVRGPLNRREQKALSSAAQGKEKGRGKEVDAVGKQVCGICLSEEQKGAIRGLLDCCAHYFCFACIMEWSKVESRCPLCKQRFKTISQSARSGARLSLSEVVKRIPKRDQVYQPSEEEMRNYLHPYANVVCMECQQGGDDHLMLLCDICDSPAHTYCVGLGREVPEGNWYCDGCRPMDPGSSNSHFQESMVEQETRNSDLSRDNFCENVSENATNCMPHETPRQSATLPSPRQSLSGVSQDASRGYHSSLGDHGTPLPASGSAASTLSGRRSIHQHIRTMLSNRIRWAPEGVARNVVTQPSHVVTQPSRVESDICSFEVDHPGETLNVQEESPVNGRNGSSNRSFLTPRASVRPCTHNEATSFSIVEGTKARVQSIVKNHLKRLSRDIPLEYRDFKGIARQATHTVLAACGVQHRRSMVNMPVGPPPNCVHQSDGELSGLVKDCCSVCFASFVGNVVHRLADLRLQPTHTYDGLN